jgi:hypothetical protein
MGFLSMSKVVCCCEELAEVNCPGPGGQNVVWSKMSTSPDTLERRI